MADPNFEYPLLYRIAQFLLQSGDQLGQYSGGLQKQAAGASDILESQGRQQIQQDVLTERRREATVKEQERAQAAQDKAAALAEKQRRRGTTSSFIAALGKGAPSGQALADLGESASDLEPEAYKFALADLLKKPAPPEYASGEFGIFSKQTGEIKTPKPATSPAPSAERDYHMIAQDMLGPSASPAQIAAKVRALALADQKEIAQHQGAIILGTQRTMADERDRLERGQKADEAQAELTQVETILGKMEAAVPKVNAPGLLGRVAGLTTRKLEEFKQTSPDINQLASLGQGYISVIAKIVQRQSGILSNQDLERAEKSVPQVSDNLEVAQMKLGVLRDILTAARHNLTILRGGVQSGAPSRPAPATSGTPPGFTPR